MVTWRRNVGESFSTFFVILGPLDALENVVRMTFSAPKVYETLCFGDSC